MMRFEIDTPVRVSPKGRANYMYINSPMGELGCNRPILALES